ATLSEENLEVMRFIYQQNNLGIKPSYSDIGKKLEISRPTARKRIKRLVATGYLIDSKKGNSKVLELTEKGKLLFLR
ncbi:MAG: HTH domain-containing protein, partial [Candidatus Hodarchaeota archaeon]